MCYAQFHLRHPRPPMPIELDHFLVPSHDQVAAARQLAAVARTSPWAPHVPWRLLSRLHQRRPDPRLPADRRRLRRRPLLLSRQPRPVRRHPRAPARGRHRLPQPGRPARSTRPATTITAARWSTGTSRTATSGKSLTVSYARGSNESAAARAVVCCWAAAQPSQAAPAAGGRAPCSTTAVSRAPPPCPPRTPFTLSPAMRA